MTSMKSLKTFVAIATLPAFVSLANAAAINDLPALDQCVKRFGTAGSKTEVFGFLPFSGDYFFGNVVIGDPDPYKADDYVVKTRFTSGDFTYHQHLKKDIHLDLDTDKNQRPSSGCVDYVNEANRGMEVVQLNWKGSSTIVASSSLSLRYHSFGPFSCYLGIDNGEWNIVLMCKLRLDENGVKQTVSSGYDVLKELNHLFFSPETADSPATICGLLQTGQVNAVMNSYALCMDKINAVKGAEFDPGYNSTTGYTGGVWEK